MNPQATVKACLELCRIGNLPSIWTNVLAAAVLATGGFALTSYLMLALALSALYLAGMCLNDLCDLQHDRVHRPDRPLPSGRITLLGARVLTSALFATGFVLMLFAPHRAGLYVAMVLFVAIVCYDLRHKDKPLSVLLMAFCRFLVFAVTACALTGAISAPVAVAASAQFCYVLALSLVARHESNRSRPFRLPVIPYMLSGICLLDGVLLAFFKDPAWLAAGIGGALLMTAGQKLFRGD